MIRIGADFINQRLNPSTIQPTPSGSNAWDDTRISLENQPRIITIFAPAPGLLALDFLRQARGLERFYWAEPETKHTQLTMAGVGIAAELSVAPMLQFDTEDDSHSPGYRFEAIAQQGRELFADTIVLRIGSFLEKNRPDDQTLNRLLRPRFFGGFAFQDDFTPDNTWSVYQPAHFILPHYLYIRSGLESYLAINALVTSDESIDETIDALEDALTVKLATVTGYEAEPSSQNRATCRFPMSATMWQELIQTATSQIQAGRLDKVVLARVCEVQFDRAIEATAPLEYLDNHYADCYRFLFEPVPFHGFFGATPELLVEKNGRDLETMALAGSTSRGKTPDQDELFARELAHSAKDLHEHQFVVTAIVDHLLELTTTLTMPETPQVIRLRNIQHLYTPIQGCLNPDRVDSVLDLVRRLHPTPALGGVPAGQSNEFLKRYEPVPRGWYAAPIGWFDNQQDGVFAVAIRSAVTQHNRAWLYAGAGIVAASEAEREWAETWLKFRPMLEALGVNDRV